MYPFSTPWKHKKDVFCCFQGVEKRCLGNEWVKDPQKLKNKSGNSSSELYGIIFQEISQNSLENTRSQYILVTETNIWHLHFIIIQLKKKIHAGHLLLRNLTEKKREKSYEVIRS